MRSVFVSSATDYMMCDTFWEDKFTWNVTCCMSVSSVWIFVTLSCYTVIKNAELSLAERGHVTHDRNTESLASILLINHQLLSIALPVQLASSIPLTSSMCSLSLWFTSSCTPDLRILSTLSLKTISVPQFFWYIVLQDCILWNETHRSVLYFLVTCG